MMCHTLCIFYLQCIMCARAYPTTLSQQCLVRMDGWMDQWINGSMDQWINGWINGWMDGWMDRWINGWMDG